MSFLVRTSRRPRTFSVKITTNTFKLTTSRVHTRSNFIIGSLLCHLIVIFVMFKLNVAVAMSNTCSAFYVTP